MDWEEEGSPEGGSSSPSAEDYISSALQRWGNPYAAAPQLQAARFNNPSSLPLRNAEHALFSQSLIDQYPVMGPLAVMGGVPAYSAAKWVAQTLPGGSLLDYLMPKGLELSTASSPSFQEMYWGLKPLWSRLR